MVFTTNAAIIEFTISIHSYVVVLGVYFGDVGVEIASTSLGGVSVLFCCQCESSCGDIEWV